MSSKAQKFILWDEEARDLAARLVAGLKLGAKPWQVIVKPFYESPSDRQRGYYRAEILPALCKHVEECGFGHYTGEQMHGFLLKKFGEASRVEIDGEAYEVSAFTTSNAGDVAAMSVFITNVLQWAAADLGLYIAPPRERFAGRRRAA